ncbi:hypothetical protein P8452_58139 [Trifolium repens]|nr:hypothetical protein P8452_58139 [Trifolium repens]
MVFTRWREDGMAYGLAAKPREVVEVDCNIKNEMRMFLWLVHKKEAERMKVRVVRIPDINSWRQDIFNGQL